MRSLSCFLVLVVAIIGDIVAEKLLTAGKHTPRDICRAQETWTLVQDAEDCRRFYVCAYNKIEEFNCAENYHFSARDMRCVMGSCEEQKEHEGELHVEEKEGELHAVEEEEELHAVEEEEEQAGEDEDEDQEEEEEEEEEEHSENEFVNVQTQPNHSQEADSSTTNKCKIHTVQRVENDCTIYRQCMSGVFVSKRCAVGTYFDMAFRSCLPIDISARHRCSCQLPDNATLPNPSDCETFYRCEHGIAVLQQCPRDQYYEASVSSCLPDLTGICLEHPTMPTNLDDSVAYAQEECKTSRYITTSHVSNCAKFFLCGRGSVREMSCPLGHFYDPLSRFCRKDVSNMCTERQLETPVKQKGVEEEKNAIIEEFVKDQTEKAASNFNKFSSKFGSM